VTRSLRAPFLHPLAPIFDAAVDSLGAALAPESIRQYRDAVRNFLTWLGACHPEVVSLDQLRRDPHILGWMTRLRSRVPPLAPITYILRLTFLRGALNELAWTARMPELGQLLRREDIPRRPRSLPRALSNEHDQLLQQELRRRNDLGSNFFLLLRHTGMRIGEAVDLSFDCLHTSGPDHWTVHVPLGKLKTERLVPVDSFTRDLLHRLRFFRWLDPSAPDGHLLARPVSRHMLIRQLRSYLHEVSAAAGIPGRIVPHQLRHTYASEMLRCGVDLPALMKLLGHTSPEMTMVYLDIALTDLQREFDLACSHPRHAAPPPRAPASDTGDGFAGVLDALLTAQHVLEMYRRSLSEGESRCSLDRLGNRLTKILAAVRKLQHPSK
jgi:integrase